MTQHLPQMPGEQVPRTVHVLGTTGTMYSRPHSDPAPLVPQMPGEQVQRQAAQHRGHHLLPQRGVVGAAAHGALGHRPLPGAPPQTGHPGRRLLRYG